MKLEFYKYQGTGNDFVVIDDRIQQFDITDEDRIRNICNRRKGVGADGLILLRSHLDADFEMLYFNANGKEGSMCGNGGRCLVDFAHFLGIIEDDCTFIAIDGLHEAKWTEESVAIKMIDVFEVEVRDKYVYLDTGSPHYVQFVKDLKNYPVFEQGKSIRYNERFKQNGTNVNFVEILGSSCMVRTYERGVENETFACGTGVTAVAIAAHANKKNLDNPLSVSVLGGILKVSFEEVNGIYKNVWLTGHAKQVFKGSIKC
ncbi:MAG: diaminopimelate epimerase [Flavobacteriales bacterium]|nr:diaminopimelate epimerase [Flavobacteriales bacterium]|tara:strand:- start:11192 stop:11968 length:777 start_codon:yes stop_codon:yes gene_type:complete